MLGRADKKSVTCPCEIMQVYWNEPQRHEISALKMDTISASETLVCIYKSTRRYNPDHRLLQPLFWKAATWKSLFVLHSLWRILDWSDVTWQVSYFRRIPKTKLGIQEGLKWIHLLAKYGRPCSGFTVPGRWHEGIQTRWRHLANIPHLLSVFFILEVYLWFHESLFPWQRIHNWKSFGDVPPRKGLRFYLTVKRCSWVSVVPVWEQSAKQKIWT